MLYADALIEYRLAGETSNTFPDNGPSLHVRKVAKELNVQSVGSLNLIDIIVTFLTWKIFIIFQVVVVERFHSVTPSLLRPFHCGLEN